MDTQYEQASVGTIAEGLLTLLTPNEEGGVVVGLRGDLGAGKTTLVQALAQRLGVAETVTSPTFVVAKWYRTEHHIWKTLIHIDAYRIEDEGELNAIGWRDILATKGALIVVEWPEKIIGSIPAHAKHFSITHLGDIRHITQL